MLRDSGGYKKLALMPIVLIPFTLIDFMTGLPAIPYTYLPQEVVDKMVEAVLTVPGTFRVLYDLAAKPPWTKEWECFDLRISENMVHVRKLLRSIKGGTIKFSLNTKKKIHIFVILVQFGVDYKYGKSSLLILLFFSPLLSQLTWIGFNISIFGTANIHLPSVQHCRFDSFGSFAPSGPHATTFSSSSCRCCLRLHLIAVFVDVFAFISVSSSWSSSPSSPSRRLGRLRLHLRLVVLVVFAFISVSSSWSSSPSSPSRRLGRLRLHLRLVVLVVFAFISVSSSSTSLSTPSPPSRRLRRLCLRHHLVAGFSFALHAGNSPWIIALVLFYFALLCLS
ncbi:hypothetical protein OUZ56_023315 [Daphnia magna]|uniref:Uncharacterized protein n=1 Tax=Daphnia magna TaxID=35525 RepID=A0ABR0AYV1_9CRUS|nr:hypothetical protein OUZ56_023315 [Daphnia magna]